jgi:hypothetical protein
MPCFLFNNFDVVVVVVVDLVDGPGNGWLKEKETQT